MDKIYESYQKISEAKPSNNVPLEEMPQSKAEWMKEINSCVSKLNKRFKALKFTVNKVDWDEVKMAQQKGILASFTIDITVNVDVPYIDSIPYVNLTKAFYTELDKVVGEDLGVDKINLNNTGSAFWGSLLGYE